MNYKNSKGNRLRLSRYPLYVLMESKVDSHFQTETQDNTSILRIECDFYQGKVVCQEEFYKNISTIV